MYRGNNKLIKLKNISKDYTDEFGYKVNLFKDISVEIPNNKTTLILAPSGSGKSSLLKILCGLEKVSAGEIENEGNNFIAYIPSEPSSFPWLNVRNNITFGVDNPDSVKADEIAKKVGLEGYETHFPHNKSLGFRFRIALARSLYRNPSFIVIDEPFNKMDELTKSELYDLILQINKSDNTSFVFATTNISEALYLADKIFLMKKNPGEIFETVDVQFQTRNMDLFLNSDFVQLRNKLEHSFKTIDSQKLFNISI